MNEPILYRGHWPQNVSKTAKYAIRIIDGKWKITVKYDLGEGLEFLAVESGDTDIAARVNRIKTAISGQEGGSFYINEYQINEYQHLIVPVTLGGVSHYYFGGKVDCIFQFEFEGKRLSSEPVNLDGTALAPGDPWAGPRPGIPYKLAAGGNDIYYFESPVLTDTSPPQIRQNLKRKVCLSTFLKDRALITKALRPVRGVRGYLGGRFYVNEHRAIFTPVDQGEGKGLNYVYCGQIDLAAWFPEPTGGI